MIANRPTLQRMQTNVTVGVADTPILGPNPRRWAVILSIPNVAPNEPKSQTALASAVNTTTTGVKLTYTTPALTQAVLESASYVNTAGTAATAALQIIRAATTFNIEVGSANFVSGIGMPLQAGDIVQWNVTVAGTTSTADFTLGILQNSATDSTIADPGVVWINFAGAAALNVGIPLSTIDPPLVLMYDHFGQAITEGFRGITQTIGKVIGVLDIFEVDCDCPMGGGQGTEAIVKAAMGGGKYNVQGYR